MKSGTMLAFAAAAALAGCTVGPSYRAPKVAMPQTFSVVPQHPTTAAAPVDLTRWWQSLNDPLLDRVIDTAVRNNYDLEIALDRLQEARAQEAVVDGGTLPVAEVDGTVARGSGTNSTKGRIAPPLNAGTNTTGYHEITDVAGFDAGWEFDFFGKYRREMEAAHDNTQAAAEARNAVLMVVISDAARAYMDIRANQLRLAIAHQDLQAEQKSVNVIQARFTRGITNELDLALARRQFAQVQASIPPLAAQLNQAQRRLSVLLGEFPQQLWQQMVMSAPLPQLPRNIATGIPVDLLRRRPDIRQAERQLAMATAQIGVATANLFPTVGVTAGVGIQGQGFGRTPEKTSFLWSAGPTAYWPVLDFGVLDAAIEVQNFTAQQMLANYKRTILLAVEEVENAIENFDAEQAQIASLQSALVASQRALSLASQRYDRGLTDFLNVLDAQRQLYALQDQYATAQEQAVLQFIALYKSLGGGWQAYQRVPGIRQPRPAILATFAHLDELLPH